MEFGISSYTILGYIFPIILIAIFCIYLKRKSKKEKELLDSYGVKTTGTIYKYVIHRNIDTNESHQDYVCFEFVPNGSGEKILSTWNINNYELEDKYPIGTQIEVEYLPDKPKICRPIFS